MELALNILLVGGMLVDRPAGGPIASGKPRGLDILREGSQTRVSTSEGDCPLEKMEENWICFSFPLLSSLGEFTKVN